MKAAMYTIEHLSPGITIIDTSARKHFSDPFNPTRLAIVKEAVDMNVWSSFLYDVFLDGGCHAWVEEIPSFIA
jgi:hypothetical protein